MPDPRVLVVEDDAHLRGVLRRGLGEEGFEVAAVGRGGEAIEAVASAVPDALVVDIGLPDADGRDVCQALRAEGIDAPVLFLTARDAVTDRLAGFSAGGDDYIVKPFELAELVARLRAILRRTTWPSPGAISSRSGASPFWRRWPPRPSPHAGSRLSRWGRSSASADAQGAILKEMPDP